MNRGSAWKPILIGCGIAAFLFVAVVVGVIIWLASGPESGVKMANEMDKYALDYLESHKMLNGTEKLIAYYDATMKMNGTEAAILTTERVLYHKNGMTTSIPLRDIVDVKHSRDTFVGDTIVVIDKQGMRMKIEIAPLNDGELFYNALMDSWKVSGQQQ